MEDLSRRHFLGLAAGTAAVAASSACGSSSSGGTPSSSVPPAPPSSGSAAPFDNVVLLTMENRSFDHLIGWFPNANGKQAGLSYQDKDGTAVATWDLGTDYQGCSYNIPAHQWQGMKIQWNDGKMDGWLQTGPVGDTYPVGYYTESAVPITGFLARNFTLLDAYFPSLLAGTYPNEIYQHAAQTDTTTTGFFPGSPGWTVASGTPGTPTGMSTIKTLIWDRLKAAKLTGKYYQQGEPITGLFTWGPYPQITQQPNFAQLAAAGGQNYQDITTTYEQFRTDAKNGTLPNVSFLQPEWTTLAEVLGTSNDQHTWGSIQAGEKLIADVYNAIRTSPQANKTVFILTWDEGGGFYDTVPPPQVAEDSSPGIPGGPSKNPNYKQLGTRVPCIVISPWSQAARVETRGPYEHCSTLRMIEWRWNLQPMTARDANARNLAEVLNFTTTNTNWPTLPAFTPAPDGQCTANEASKRKSPPPLAG